MKVLPISLIICFLAVTARAQEVPERKKDAISMLRILCVGTVKGAEEIVIASKDEEGKWKELSEAALRPTFVSDWLPVAKGTLHVATRSGGELISIGSFIYPQKIKRGILVMVPDQALGKYRLDLIDPTGLGFSKGTSLVVNYSKLPAVVQLGAATKTVPSGGRLTMKASFAENKMFRMLIGYMDEAGSPVACYDRYLKHNPQSRDFLLLFSDPNRTGITVFNLAEFGPFD